MRKIDSRIRLVRFYCCELLEWRRLFRQHRSKLEQLTLSKSGPLYPSKPDLHVGQEHFAVGPATVMTICVREPFDVLIRGGRIVDGTTWFHCLREVRDGP